MTQQKTLKIGPKDMCQFYGCLLAAEALAYFRRTMLVGKYCERHAEQVVDADTPEYDITCQNCGCRQGVN